MSKEEIRNNTERGRYELEVDGKLAVVRAQLADLPLKFRFDDSMALPGGKKISGFKTVSVEARVAKAGKAQSSSGDLFGSIKGVKPGSKNIKLVIDQIQP